MAGSNEYASKGGSWTGTLTNMPSSLPCAREISSMESGWEHGTVAVLMLRARFLLSTWDGSLDPRFLRRNRKWILVPS